MTLPEGFGGSRQESKKETSLSTYHKEMLDGLSPKQFNELKSMIAEKKSPVKEKVKEATKIHHSYRVMFVVMGAVLLPMLGIIGYLGDGLFGLMITLAGATIIYCVIAFVAKDHLDAWTNPEDEDQRKKHRQNRNFY